MSESPTSNDGVDQAEFDEVDIAAQMHFLKSGYDALALRDERNDKRIAAGEGQRKTIWIVMAIALALAVAAVGFVIYLSFSSASKTAVRNTQQMQTQREIAGTQMKIHRLVCTVTRFTPPGNPATDTLRSQYNCPPYVRPAPAP